MPLPEQQHPLSSQQEERHGRSAPREDKPRTQQPPKQQQQPSHPTQTKPPTEVPVSKPEPEVQQTTQEHPARKATVPQPREQSREGNREENPRENIRENIREGGFKDHHVRDNRDRDNRDNTKQGQQHRNQRRTTVPNYQQKTNNPPNRTRKPSDNTKLMDDFNFDEANARFNKEKLLEEVAVSFNIKLDLFFSGF
jgi:hypothetical protein